MLCQLELLAYLSGTLHFSLSTLFKPSSLYVQHVSCNACSIFSEQVFPLYFSCSLLSNSSCFYSLYIVKVLYPAFFRPPLTVFHVRYLSLRSRTTDTLHVFYSITSVTTPAPTVRPPSLTANLNSFSIAIGTINSTDIVTLSPGITISTPSGSCATPVTSVVLK